MAVNPLVDVKADVIDVTGQGSAGAVTSVGANAPITSSGGATPVIGITTPLALNWGGTFADLSATGGAKQYLKQAGVGSALTVGTIPATDLTNVVLADGTVPLTAGWNAGNFPISYQNSMSVFNVVAYGADPTGAADSTTAINNAIAAVPATGGTVYFPAGSYKLTSGLSIGNGSSSTLSSTPQHITLLGDGCGATAVEVNVNTGVTNLLWYGGAGGTMVTVNGPISGVRIEGFHFNGKSSTNAADRILYLVHPINSVFARLTAENYNVAAYDITAYDGAAGGGVFATGANGNLWYEVNASHPFSFTAEGLRVGASTTGAAPRLNVAHNVFVCCAFDGGKNAAGIELRFTDNLSFIGAQGTVGTGGSGTGLLVTPPSGTGGTTVPAAITFSSGYVSQAAGAGWAGTSGIQFLPWDDDRGANPIPTANWAYGVDMQGNVFGKWDFRDLTRMGNNALTPAPQNAATALQVVSPNASASVVEIDATAAAQAAILNFRRARGTAGGGETAVQNLDIIWAIQGYGYGATGFSSSRGGDYLTATENWTDAAQGTRRILQTTQTGTTTTAERFAVENDGVLTNTRRGLQMNVPGLMFSQTADSTTTPNSLTTLLGTGAGTLTLPANFLGSGRTIRLKLGGYVSVVDGGAATKTLTLSLGGTSVATGTSIALFATLVNQDWRAEATITCRTAGSPGTVQASGRWETQITGSNALSGVDAISTATTNITTTGALAIDLKFNNGSATGTVTTTWATVEVLN